MSQVMIVSISFGKLNPRGEIHGIESKSYEYEN